MSGLTKNVLSVSLNELVHTVVPVDLYKATDPAHFWISHHLIMQHNKHVGNHFLVTVLILNGLFHSVDLRDLCLSVSPGLVRFSGDLKPDWRTRPDSRAGMNPVKQKECCVYTLSKLHVC